MYSIKVLAGQARVVLREIMGVQIREVDMSGVQKLIEVLSRAFTVLLVEVDSSLQGKTNIGDRDVAAVTRTRKRGTMRSDVL